MNVPPQNDQLSVPVADLEIKDAQVIFDNVWSELEEEVGRENLQFPKELILLGGAPGSGKGTHTRFIMQLRGLTCPPIVMSSLLTTPEAQRIKAQGGLVGDTEVFGILLHTLLEEQYRDGALLDGFPRTRVQVECLKLLVDKIYHLHAEFADTPLAKNFRRPTIHAMVLFVSEATSVQRQLMRGQQIIAHNKEVEETGVGQLEELRPTDTDPRAAQHRYQVFKEQTWDALNSLREIYHYHHVHAEGPIEEVEQNIVRELQYQSSLELDPRTFDRLRAIRLAEELPVHARQSLVRRLDSYEIEHQALFVKVVALVKDKFMPIIERHSISGRAFVNTEDPVLDEPQALSMLIDIFTERGFHAVVDKTIAEVPRRFDPQTYTIECERRVTYRIQVDFERSFIRRG